MTSLTLLKHIRASLKQLSKSERRVADWVLAHPEVAPTVNISVLAEHAKVSDPTIIRFCRSVGCQGFQEFKIRLAQELASSVTPNVQFDIDDGISDIKEKYQDMLKSSLYAVYEDIDNAKIEHAANILQMSQCILISGFGASQPLAQYVFQQLHKHTDKVTLHSDMHVQTTAASRLQRGDVMIAISQTGQESFCFDLSLTCKRRQASLIAVCPYTTPIANIADIALSTVSEQGINKPQLSMHMQQHIVLDLLIAKTVLLLSNQAQQVSNNKDPQAMIKRYLEQPDLVEQALW